MLFSISRFLLPLSLLPFVLAPSELSFQPGKGTRWRKSFTVATETELEQFRVVFGGEEVPAEFLPQMDMTLTSEAEFAFVDGYGSLQDGRPLSLQRKFEAIDSKDSSSFSMEGEGTSPESHDSAVVGHSAIEGKTVEFEWDASSEAYARHEGEGATSEELLAGLVEETDLRSWLPEEDIAIGASWKLEGEALDALLHPGGDLAIERTGEGAEYWPADFRSRVLEGEIELTLSSIEEATAYTPQKPVEESHRARIAIAGEVREVVEREGDLSRVPVAQGEATQVDTTTYHLDGELVWDLATGMPHDLSLAARFERVSVTTKDEGEPEYEHSLTFRGNMKVAMECREAR